jgi:hypothetical protein
MGFFGRIYKLIHMFAVWAGWLACTFLHGVFRREAGPWIAKILLQAKFMP